MILLGRLNRAVTPVRVAGVRRFYPGKHHARQGLQWTTKGRKIAGVPEELQTCRSIRYTQEPLLPQLADLQRAQRENVLITFKFFLILAAYVALAMYYW